MKAKEEGTFTIDPSKKPKEIDLKVDVGPEQERGIWKGIYELSGDELKLCFGLPDGDRPKDFDSTGGEDPRTEVILFKLKRIK